jgi:Domain of unknown function (DUF4129)
MSQPSPVTRDGAQRAAQRELSKSIYHRNSEPFPVRFVHWAGHLVDRALHSALKHSPTGSSGALALIVIVVVIVVVVIWRVGVPRRATATGAVLPTGRAIAAADHRALSEAAAANGEWHTAVVERMRAIARELEERSVLEPRAGRTATELAREAGTILPTANTALRQATDLFNDIAYGGGQGSRAGIDVMIAADDAVRQAARSTVSVA